MLHRSAPAHWTVLPFSCTARWELWLALGLLGLPTLASAQTYRTDPVDNRAMRSNSLLVKQCVSGEVDYSQQKERFQEFFTGYFFPAMTSTDPADLGRLAGARDELIEDYLRDTNNGTLQQDLTELTFNAMVPIVLSEPPQPPYDPRVRYNAVLVLGLLDEQYARDGVPAKPYIPAVGVLYTIANSVTPGAATNKFPPALVLGALIGLERHAQLHRANPSLSQGQVGAITAVALKIATLNQPLPEAPPGVHDWIRLKAAGVLVQFGSVGNNNQVYDALLQLVADLNTLDDRCDAAGKLAKLNLQGASVDGEATAQQLLRLAADVAEAEKAQAIAFEDQWRSGGLGFTRGRSSRGRGFESDGEEKQEYPRRPLVTHLLHLRDAMEVTKNLVSPEAQAKFDTVLAAIAPVLQTATNRNPVELDIASAVREMDAEIQRVVSAPSPTPAAAEEEEEVEATDE